MRSKILVETDGAVTTIILNRPEVKNALDVEATQWLGEAFGAFQRREIARESQLADRFGIPKQ